MTTKVAFMFFGGLGFIIGLLLMLGEWPNRKEKRSEPRNL
jgi:hypothetical protein